MLPQLVAMRTRYYLPSRLREIACVRWLRRRVDDVDTAVEKGNAEFQQAGADVAEQASHVLRILSHDAHFEVAGAPRRCGSFEPVGEALAKLGYLRPHHHHAVGLGWITLEVLSM